MYLGNCVLKISPDNSHAVRVKAHDFFFLTKSIVSFLKLHFCSPDIQTWELLSRWRVKVCVVYNANK